MDCHRGSAETGAAQRSYCDAGTAEHRLGAIGRLYKVNRICRKVIDHACDKAARSPRMTRGNLLRDASDQAMHLNTRPDQLPHRCEVLRRDACCVGLRLKRTQSVNILNARFRSLLATVREAANKRLIAKAQRLNFLA